MQLRDLVYGPPRVVDPKAGLTQKPRPPKRDLWFHVESILLLAGIPTIVFAIISSTFAFVIVSLPALAWVVLLGALGLALFFVYVNFASTARRPFYLYLAILTLLATACGVVAGLWVYEGDSRQYFCTKQRVPYADVAATADSDHYQDAATIEFNSFAHVDSSRGMGRTALDGQVYCAAPIMAVNSNSYVSFWAVGIDCCETLSDFFCGDVEDASVKTGVAVPKAEHTLQMRTSMYDEFNKTIQQAAAAYRLLAPSDPMILYWEQDVHKAESRFLKETLTSLVHWWQAFSLIAICFALLLHLGTRTTSTPSWASTTFSDPRYGAVG
mmetsp:Transcript_43634/g.100651  ORF Transcript_43634/g.100651 Transcript_43634/m.100651 type:complete len:326 (-) Transcript_43634:80-1057(-)